MTLDNKDSFALYRFPYSNEFHLIKGNWSLEKSNTSTNFAITSFTDKKPVYLIGEKTIIKESIRITNSDTTSFNPLITSKDSYLKTAEEFICLCKQTSLRKIILSRIIRHPNSAEDYFTLFNKICAKYDHSFNYIMNHPTRGMWMGASPEELVVGDTKNNYTTSALAGSQQWSENISWTKKEIEEQQYVKNFIENILNKHALETNCECDLKTVKAGNIAHLKSTFTFKAAGPILNIINKIHPTPAISGFPVDQALKKITEHEKHDRSLYCGYIGEMSEKSTQLYVNLRCMQITKDFLYLHVGGGLTHLSNPNLEWEETNIKSQTLLSILKK